jgi:hypothetical protein
MLLNADVSRTVSLSDLYDETCSSSSWLQQSSHIERQTAARNSRSELCALLSLQSTSESGYRDASNNGTEPQSEASGSQLYRDSHNLSAAGALPQGPYSSRHSSIAGQQPTWPLLNVQTAGHKQRRSVTQHLPAAEAAAHPSRHRSMQQQSAHDHSALAAAVPCAAAVAGPSGAAMQGKAAVVGPAPEGSPPAGAAGGVTAGAAAAGTAGLSAPPSQKDHTERKLVKCLKKLQQDKQRYV